MLVLFYGRTEVTGKINRLVGQKPAVLAAYAERIFLRGGLGRGGGFGFLYLQFIYSVPLFFLFFFIKEPLNSK